MNRTYVRMRVKYPWADIQCYYDAGRSAVECREKYGIYSSTWNKAASSGRLRLGEADLCRPGEGRRTKYDWEAIRTFYHSGRSFIECQQRFGFCRASWTKAIQRGAIAPRSREWSVERVLAESRSRLTIKRTLLKAGILKNRCDECGLSEWRGRHISIQLDHRNGVRDDHRVENLRMLCPNCHSQTETFAARNIRRIPGSSNGRTAGSDSAYCGSSP